MALRRFHHRRPVVGHGAARGTDQQGGLAGCLGVAQGEKTCGALVEMHDRRQTDLGHAENQGRATRPRRQYDLLDATAREFLDDESSPTLVVDSSAHDVLCMNKPRIWAILSSSSCHSDGM
uniref:Uncharacterized protein n=1 Tax=Candidatus Kentrum sp. LPFa TaxID=2126335 RepID=A0A450W811_9GAMM|nr:MAG: hypothetical protein BECKLPF1236B_GA0070989_104415 [Candidatus Kentron sp. LPFa]